MTYKNLLHSQWLDINDYPKAARYKVMKNATLNDISNKEDYDYLTPLHVAVSQGNTDIGSYYHFTYI
jgi:hypothetical protein